MTAGSLPDEKEEWGTNGDRGRFHLGGEHTTQYTDVIKLYT